MSPSGSSSSDKASSDKDRRAAQREEIRRQRQAELKRQKRIRTTIIAAVAVVALAIAAGIGWAIYQSTRPAGPVTPPQGVAADQPYYQSGADSGKPVVDVYLDYMCPICNQFEQLNGAELKALADADQITLREHTRTFLDPMSTTGDYSTRAANALACVADEGEDKRVAMNTLLFENQPAERTPGLTNAQLTEYAKQAGASDAVADCISSKKHVSWLHDVVEPEAQKSAPNGTPTVLIDGEVFQDWSTPGALTQALGDAGADTSAASGASDAGGAPGADGAAGTASDAGGN